MSKRDYRAECALLHETLRVIAKEFMTPAQIRRDCERNGHWPDYTEALEMAYENIQGKALSALRMVRKPTTPGHALHGHARDEGGR